MSDSRVDIYETIVDSFDYGFFSKCLEQAGLLIKDPKSGLIKGINLEGDQIDLDETFIINQINKRNDVYVEWWADRVTDVLVQHCFIGTIFHNIVVHIELLEDEQCSKLVSALKQYFDQKALQKQSVGFIVDILWKTAGFDWVYFMANTISANDIDCLPKSKHLKRSITVDQIPEVLSIRESAAKYIDFSKKGEDSYELIKENGFLTLKSNNWGEL